MSTNNALCMSTAQNEGVTPWFSAAGNRCDRSLSSTGGFHAIFGQVVCCRSFRGSGSLARALIGACKCPSGTSGFADFAADPAADANSDDPDPTDPDPGAAPDYFATGSYFRTAGCQTQ